MLLLKWLYMLVLKWLSRVMATKVVYEDDFGNIC
jgi:hypothetical protein